MPILMIVEDYNDPVTFIKVKPEKMELARQLNGMGYQDTLEDDTPLKEFAATVGIKYALVNKDAGADEDAEEDEDEIGVADFSKFGELVDSPIGCTEFSLFKFD